jgi:redox-sensitive bicupin YhaK (pirin superfamily)
MTHYSNQNSAWYGKIRELVQLTSGIPASDGDGVQLTRIIGSPEINMVDPFLLLDSFESDQPNDYIGGFPDHPHRGFETVTYLLAGRMRHKDNAGHEGVIEPGGVQWMTAGCGIVHSDMPEQKMAFFRASNYGSICPHPKRCPRPNIKSSKQQKSPLKRLQRVELLELSPVRRTRERKGQLKIGTPTPCT